MSTWSRLLAVLALPFLVVVKLFMLPFERPASKSAADVASVLRRYLKGTCTHEEWDEFVCVTIEDPQQDGNRMQAMQFDELDPLEADGSMRSLLAQIDDA